MENDQRDHTSTYFRLFVDSSQSDARAAGLCPTLTSIFCLMDTAGYSVTPMVNYSKCVCACVCFCVLVASYSHKQHCLVAIGTPPPPTHPHPDPTPPSPPQPLWVPVTVPACVLPKFHSLKQRSGRRGVRKRSESCHRGRILLLLL